MTSIVPELDDIEFDRLVEDGRGLIPRYAPAWTDHNLHDPGITLIDLIAWLVDQQVYRIGFVGDSLRTAFTRLMGISPRGPEAAQILIWPKDWVQEMSFAEGTEIRSPDAVEARFTLMGDVRTVATGINGMSTWTDGVRKPLGDGLTEGRDPVDLLPAWGGGPQMLEIELEQPIVPLAVSGPVSLGFAVSAEMGAADWEPVVLEQWDSRGFWRVLDTLDCTGGLRHSGVILFRPEYPSSVNAEGPDASRFRLRLDQGLRPGSVRITRIGLNVLPAREGWDDPSGVIGEGSGLPDQTVEVETSDVLNRDRTLVIETNVGGVETRWERREDLTSSGPGDPHYMLTEQGIVFGNGINGPVVPLGAQIRMGPVRRTSGAEGAVSAGLQWTIAGVVFGTNIAASTPGRDCDGLTELLTRARKVSRTREGLLSAGALRESLMSAGLGLADVQVTAQRRPGLEGKDAPGSRTVLVLPIRDPSQPPSPFSERLRDEIERVLAPLRLLGERLYVSPPVYVGVDVVLKLVVEADADVSTVRAEAEAIVRARLWDLPRRSDVEPWPAGRDVTVGEIQGLVAGRDEVVRIPDCRIARSGSVPGRAAVELSDREIALAKAVTVEVVRDGTPAANQLPVWIDIELTLVTQPTVNKWDVAQAVRGALREWSQAGGIVTLEDIGNLASRQEQVLRVAGSAITVAGGVPGTSPIPLQGHEVARTGLLDIEVRYPSEEAKS